MNAWSAVTILGLGGLFALVTIRLRVMQSRETRRLILLNERAIERMLRAATRGMVESSRGIGEAVSSTMAAVIAPPPPTPAAPLVPKQAEAHLREVFGDEAFEAAERELRGRVEADPTSPWYLRPERAGAHEADPDPLDLDTPLDRLINPEVGVEVEGLYRDAAPYVEGESGPLRPDRAMFVPPGFDPIAQIRADAEDEER